MELLLQSFRSNRPKKKMEHSEEFIATNAIKNASKAEVQEETLVEAEEADINLQLLKPADEAGFILSFFNRSYSSPCATRSISCPQQTSVPPPAFVTSTSFPQMLQRYFSPTFFTAIFLFYNIYPVGLLGIEPSLHPPHGRVLPAYSTPIFNQFIITEKTIFFKKKRPRQGGAVKQVLAVKNTAVRLKRTTSVID